MGCWIVGGYMFEGLLRPMHLLVILIIALLFFGPKRLPELGKSLGDALRGFKKGMGGDEPSKPAETAERGKDDSNAPKA
jgi:sec-independent protein translocase protein TatA